jgi:F-type H+-transporting ATPase subunit c
MTKKVLFVLALSMLASTMAFAQGSGGAPAASNQWIQISSAFGMAIASGLCALGQGAAIKGACEGMARNPGAAAAIRLAMLLGLVFIESLALYTLVIIFIKVVP